MAYCRPLKRKMPKILKVFNITPIPKPRMTQRDRWTMRPQDRHRARPCVLDYLEYKEELQFQAFPDFEMPESGYQVTFVMPMPKSWSIKKKESMNSKPHQQAPDKDNLEKALLDALCSDGDAHIWDGRVTKIWGYEGQIIITKEDAL